MPDYTGQTVPYGHPDFPTVSEIIPGLYQGVRPDSYSGYALVVNCEQHLTAKPRKNWGGWLVHIPMDDEDDYLIPTPALVGAAAFIDKVLKDSGNVLVHCTGGLNRSSLVTATYLIYHRNMNGHEAVDQLRRARDPYCLCNEHFHTHITQYR